MKLYNKVLMKLIYYFSIRKKFPKETNIIITDNLIKITPNNYTDILYQDENLKCGSIFWNFNKRIRWDCKFRVSKLTDKNIYVELIESQ